MELSPSPAALLAKDAYLSQPTQSSAAQGFYNIRPENYQKLLADLRQRTGLNVIKIEIGKIDYLSDSAQLVVFCAEQPRKTEQENTAGTGPVTVKETWRC